MCAVHQAEVEREREDLHVPGSAMLVHAELLRTYGLAVKIGSDIGKGVPGGGSSHPGAKRL
jgi:hypothetical protein